MEYRKERNSRTKREKPEGALGLMLQRCRTRRGNVRRLLTIGETEALREFCYENRVYPNPAWKEGGLFDEGWVNENPLGRVIPPSHGKRVANRLPVFHNEDSNRALEVTFISYNQLFPMGRKKEGKHQTPSSYHPEL